MFLSAQHMRSSRFVRGPGRFSLAFFLVACLITVPRSANGQLPAAESSSSEIVLRSGDVLQVRVWRKPELSGDFVVSANGSIGDPFYAPVRVGGLTITEARASIRNHVARIETDPLVWVEPLLRVVVTGEVRQPGLYPVGYPTSIAQAIAQAGGALPTARLDRVRLIRAGNAELVDLRNPTSPLARVILLSGDEVLVPRRSEGFRSWLAPISTLASVGALIATISYNRSRSTNGQ